MNECIYFRLKPIEHKNTKHTNTYKETDSKQKTNVKQNISYVYMSNKTILCNLTLIRQANTTIKNQCIKVGQTKIHHLQ